MKLEDLINKILDSTYVILIDTNGNELARYDGRDSLPNIYNKWEVVGMGNSLKADRKTYLEIMIM